MGRAIKLILYYLAYQLLFIFLGGNRGPMPPLLLSAEQILQPTSALWEPMKQYPIGMLLSH